MELLNYIKQNQLTSLINLIASQVLKMYIYIYRLILFEGLILLSLITFLQRNK